MSDTKNYLIVGGTSGIGLALVNLLEGAGHTVVHASRSAPHITFNALHDQLELNSLPEVLDGVAYCPGSINLKPFHRLTENDIVEDFRINVVGAIRTLQQVLPLLKKAEQASVVLFSTVAVQQGMAFHASVAAAKGAVEGLTRSLAAEWAPKIRVNAIAPSLTQTPLAEKLLATEDKKKAAAERHPLKHIGSADGIARMASFLLTEQADWITGQVLHVDGGLSSIRT
ncbi:MAG: SDR family oxidoreductase [Cyclobacteriaceae bacterium]|nr:SDR family oxidoreductase [Cyclobacteriaceae bacterium]